MEKRRGPVGNREPAGTVRRPLPRGEPVVSRHRTSLLVVAALAGLVWAAGCGDGATEPPSPRPDPPRPTTVTVSPATAELTAVGATTQLSVEVRDQNRQVMTGR